MLWILWIDLWIMINLFDALTILEKVIALRWILQKLKIAICYRKYESLIENTWNNMKY